MNIRSLTISEFFLLINSPWISLNFFFGNIKSQFGYTLYNYNHETFNKLRSYVDWFLSFTVINCNSIIITFLQNFHQPHHQIITTLNGAIPTTQLTTYIIPEDEISKKLPKEILLRILSYLDVISLCRCAQVSWKELLLCIL